MLHRILAKNCEQWFMEHKFIDLTMFSPATLNPKLRNYNENVQLMSLQVRKLFHFVGGLDEPTWIFLPYNIEYEFTQLHQ